MHLLHRLIFLAALTACCMAQSAEVAVNTYGQVTYASCTADVQVDHIALFWKSETDKVYGSLDALADSMQSQGKHMVCGTNAGIYDEAQKPLGLYIESGKELRRLNVRRNAYGNFYMEPNGMIAIFADHAAIWTTAEFQMLSDEERQRIVYANQSGPILLHDGEINPQFAIGSPNLTTRNAVCVKSPSSIVLIAALDIVNFYDFATTLKSHFGCQSALYLDGTVSTFYPTKRLSFKRTLGPLIGVVKP